MLFGEALIRDIDACAPEYGSCAFWWLGQMSYIVKTARHTLYFDPYLGNEPHRLYPPPMSGAQVRNADFLFGSHDHMDHIHDDTLRAAAAASPGAKVVLPAGLAESVAVRIGLAPERILPVADGRRAETDGVRITGIAAAHEVLNDRNENMIYVVECDGVRLCHMGDTCLYEGLIARLRDAGVPDVLFLPINGRDGKRLVQNCIGNMTFQEAVDLVGTLAPRLAVPGHYDMFEGNTENPANFAWYLEIKYPDRDFWIGPHARQVRVEG